MREMRALVAPNARTPTRALASPVELPTGTPRGRVPNTHAAAGRSNDQASMRARLPPPRSPDGDPYSPNNSGGSICGTRGPPSMGIPRAFATFTASLHALSAVHLVSGSFSRSPDTIANTSE